MDTHILHVPGTIASSYVHSFLGDGYPAWIARNAANYVPWQLGAFCLLTTRAASKQVNESPNLFASLESHDAPRDGSTQTGIDKVLVRYLSGGSIPAAAKYICFDRNGAPWDIVPPFDMFKRVPREPEGELYLGALPNALIELPRAIDEFDCAAGLLCVILDCDVDQSFSDDILREHCVMLVVSACDGEGYLVWRRRGDPSA